MRPFHIKEGVQYDPVLKWRFHLNNYGERALSNLNNNKLMTKLTFSIYHHLQKFKTNFQNSTTQWKKQSWKYLLFKNIYFQQITILYHTLPPSLIWNGNSLIFSVSSTVSDVSKNYWNTHKFPVYMFWILINI